MADGARVEATGAAGQDAAGRLTIAVADLAHDVVAATVPEQLELLTAVTVAWEAGKVPGRRRWGWTGGSVEFGVDPTVTTLIIYPLLTGTLGQVLGTAAVNVRRRRRQRDVRAAQVTLDARQIEMLRSACVSYGVTLGLSKAKATVLAEAIYGVLCRALAESRRGHD